MQSSERRYDIDWLRVIAIGLLIIYHIGIAFQPWGVFIGFIQNDDSMVPLWTGMSMLNVWRIPLLFFVSGMGVCFAMRKRNWKQLLLERTRRILLPLIFGAFLIVPIHLFIWQRFYTQDIAYQPQVGHLWFLANIFIYVLALSPLFYFLKKQGKGKIHKILQSLFKTPLGLILIAGCFVVEVVLVNPENFETYASTVHGFFIGLLAFLFGFICVYSGKSFWQTVLKWRWGLIAFAAILYIIRILVFELNSPSYLKAIESCLWIFAVFGLAYKHLNHQSRILSYLSQAAYPVYILHMVFLYLGSYILFPLELPVWIKFIGVVLFTSAGCFIAYELIIKRIKYIRPLFGLKP